MRFKENQTVTLNTFGTPVDGKHVEITGRITKLTHAHAIVCFESITEGVRAAVNQSGKLGLFGAKDKVGADWTLIKIGDIEAVPLADIVPPAPKAEPIPDWITRECALHILSSLTSQFGDIGKLLDGLIEGGTVKQSIEGLLRTEDVSRVRRSYPTYAENWNKEHRKFGDEAKEFNRLGSQLHPEIFGKAW